MLRCLAFSFFNEDEALNLFKQRDHIIRPVIWKVMGVEE